MADEIIRKVASLEKDLAELKIILSIEAKEKEIQGLGLKMSSNSFWNDQKQANISVEKLKALKDDVDGFNSLAMRIKDLKEMLEVYDPSYGEEIEKEAALLEADFEKFRLRVFFRGKFDKTNAIVEINSGAGGTEACDWAQMLFRMYFRWAEEKKFKVVVYSEVRGDEAGIKNITFLIEGKLAYGLLKSEKGVHRLVRISPFDANKRRHTSFASIDVLPEIIDDISVEIKQEDLKIETYRASGCGGQHVNVTDSAVRITHLPTSLVVSCQNERSQYQNKQVALKVLKAKLYEIKEMERKKELQKISGKKRKIEWGSQIRSYVLCPYVLVKDHRTNYEEHNAQAILDGKIDNFIISYLKTTLK